MKNTNFYLSDKALAARYEVSRASIWRWAKSGQLPKPVKIFGSTRWVLLEIEELEKNLNKNAS